MNGHTGLERRGKEAKIGLGNFVYGTMILSVEYRDEHSIFLSAICTRVSFISSLENTRIVSPKSQCL